MQRVTKNWNIESMSEKKKLSVSDLIVESEPAIQRLRGILPDIEKFIREGGTHVQIYTHLKMQGLDVSFNYYKNMISRLRKSLPHSRETSQIRVENPQSPSTEKLEIEKTDNPKPKVFRPAPIGDAKPKIFEFDPHADMDKLW